MDHIGTKTPATPTRPHARTPAVDESDDAALRALVHDIERGFNDKRPDILDGAFTADAVAVVPDGTLVRGWSALYDYHTRRLSSVVNDWRMHARVLDVSRVDQDTALVHMRQEMETPERSFVNHGTLVAVRRNSRWWIGAVHNTSVKR